LILDNKVAVKKIVIAKGTDIIIKYVSSYKKIKCDLISFAL
jgi:hypothetical protein